MSDNDWYTEKNETEDLMEYTLDRRQFLAVSSTLTGVTLAGCLGDGDGDDGSSGDDAADDVSDDDRTVRLNIALPNEVWNLDPGLSTNTSDDWVNHQLYEASTQVTPEVTIEPQLATSLPDGENDAREFTYEFPSGIEFHNGKEMKAEDWLYSLEWMMDPDHKSPIQSRIFPQTEGGEIIDDYTFKIIQKEPFATWNAWVQRGLKIVPKDIREGEPGEYGGPTGLSTKLTKDPSGAGSGPFQFVEWVDGQYILIEAYDNYRDDDLPMVDEIKYNFVEETSTRISQLRSGNQDIIALVPPKDVEQINSAPDSTAETGPGRFQFRLWPNLQPVEGNPMSNIHNRKAIHYGIDRLDVIDNVYYGTAEQALGVWHPDSEDTSPRIQELNGQDIRDLDKARDHLEQAGNPDGFELELLVTSEEIYRNSAVRFQNHLSEIGIDLTVNTIERGSFYNQMYEQPDWQLLGDGWGYGVPVISYPLYGDFGTNTGNHVHWHHPSDDLPEGYIPGGPPVPDEYADEYEWSQKWFRDRLDEGRQTTDDQKRREIFWELDEYALDNCCEFNICYEAEINGWNSALENFAPSGIRKKLDNVSVNQ